MSTEPSTSERSLRRDAERNRQRIMAAAAELFAQRGLEVTMDDIADHAGVGVGTVYRRFPERELLIDALFEEGFARVQRVAEEALEHEDPWQGLVHFLERSLDLQAADRGLKALLFSTAHGRERIAQSRERLAPLVSELVARARASGELRADFVETDMPLLMIGLGSAVDFAGEVAPAIWRRALGIVLDGLRTKREAPTDLEFPPLADDEVYRAMRAWRPVGR
jgi:AcrR family transcriptional regulator